ncbi:MAG TPA: DUF262 domain-containing protein [Sumerlaeia bacterium]|nr:DUF262 domain-containing protein [Sumerlaeia bacterium]
MQKPDRSIYRPQDFLEWRENSTLDITPKFQRRGVWSTNARSFFIDTLLQLMPVPPIYLRITQGADSRSIKRQVIDGQQRIASVLDFIDGKYNLSNTLSAPWARKSFRSLSAEEKQAILSYPFSTEVFQGISDLEVLQVFSRLNTYSVPLNAQELRNGRYFGLFKQTAYRLAYENLEFWRRHKVFSERSIARMLEVELTSELLIAQLEGMQDKKKSIGDYYEKYDESFAKRNESAKRFSEIIDIINSVSENSLSETDFNRPPLFYTLYCIVFHRKFGLPRQAATAKHVQDKQDNIALYETIVKLSDILGCARNREDVPKKYESFVNACLRQTDNIKPRQERFSFIYHMAFGA